MRIENPYCGSGGWIRGSMHIHSAFSACGWHSIEELALAYRDYSFLAVSDHDRITVETDALKEHILFRGIEVSGNHHMLLVGNGPFIQEPIDHTFSVQHYGELASAAVSAGGLAIAAHPMRLYGQHWTVDELLNTEGLTGMEVLSGDGIHVDQDTGFELWDQVLSKGRRLWGFGNDDFHHWGQERRAWNVIQTAEKTPEAVLSALQRGNFYISTGFGFSQITADGQSITFRLRADTIQYQNVYRYLTLYGKDGRVLAEKTGRFQNFTYTVRGDEGYVRAEAYMSGGYGAFSQPIWIMP